MRILKVVSLLILGLVVALPCPAKVKNHAVPKIARAVVKAAAASPRITAVAIKDTLGSILFATESVVDVVHAGTTALSKAGSMELKKNPFEYVDKVAGYADTGLEKAYAYFFNLQI